MFELRFKTENAAFQCGTGREEVVRMLEKVIQQLKEGKIDSYIMDINGNKIGAWFIEGGW